jgi:hypothetical protein
MSMGSHGGMVTTNYGGKLSAEENCFVQQSCLAFYQQSHLAAGWGTGEGNSIWPCEVFLFILASDFLHAVKSYDTGPSVLLPLRMKACCGILSPLKIHFLNRL